MELDLSARTGRLSTSLTVSAEMVTMCSLQASETHTVLEDIKQNVSSHCTLVIGLSQNLDGGTTQPPLKRQAGAESKTALWQKKHQVGTCTACSRLVFTHNSQINILDKS